METSDSRDNEGKELKLAVEFSGGLELLFANVRKHCLTIPAHAETGKPSTIQNLVQVLCDKFVQVDRREMFVLDGNVRPGILVLINDADWELEGGPDYELQANDNVLFVSTLHGG